MLYSGRPYSTAPYSSVVLKKPPTLGWFSPPDNLPSKPAYREQPSSEVIRPFQFFGTGWATQTDRAPTRVLQLELPQVPLRPPTTVSMGWAVQVDRAPAVNRITQLDTPAAAVPTPTVTPTMGWFGPQDVPLPQQRGNQRQEPSNLVAFVPPTVVELHHLHFLTTMGRMRSM